MYTDRIHGLKLLNVLDQIYNKVQLLTLDKVCQKGLNANMYMYDENAFIKICMCNRQTIQEPQPDHHFFPRSEHNIEKRHNYRLSFSVCYYSKKGSFLVDVLAFQLYSCQNDVKLSHPTILKAYIA